MGYLNENISVGVDLGQAEDSTAIAVVERESRARDGGWHKELHYMVHALERLPLGTKYPRQVERIVEVMGNVRKRGFRRARLLVDATGVGRPVIDQMREKGLDPIAVTLTGSDLSTEMKQTGTSYKEFTLGKGALVSELSALVELGRIHISSKLIEARVLAEEMQAFQRRQKSDTGHLSFGASTGHHDDYITALGLACFGGDPGDPANI